MFYCFLKNYSGNLQIQWMKLKSRTLSKFHFVRTDSVLDSKQIFANLISKRSVNIRKECKSYTFFKKFIS